MTPDLRPTVAILSYHKIGRPSMPEWDTWFYIPESTFCEQLALLQAEGWTAIDVMTFLKGLQAPETLPERAALVTFDDGYLSTREAALPLLIQFGYPAVVFVPTDFIGGTNAFDTDNEPEEAMCDWDDLRELERHGVSVQSHGVSHRPFSDLDLTAQEAELAQSKMRLEAGLKKSVELFAFPYGDGGGKSRLLRSVFRRVGYRAACLYGGSPVRVPVRNPYRLARLAMGPDTDLHVELERITSR